jgi:flagellar biosynthesis protein FlhF
MPEPLAKSLIKYVIKQLGADATDEDIQNKLRTTLRSAVRTAQILDRENPKIVEGLSAKDEDEASKSDPWSLLDDDPFADTDDLAAELTIVENDSTPDSKPSTIVAFVGTSGVGKTSSLAKIAAHFANKKLRTVGLIGIETPHVGSVDRLEAYGKLMGAQFKKVRSPGQLAEAVKEMSGCAYIFIDTPACSLKTGERKNGRSPFQPKHLQLFFSAAPGVQKHLVLCANTRGRDLNATAEAFDALDVDRLLFSKLDETDALGHLFGLLEKTKLPISYLTAGQEIPGDLDEVNADEMVDRMVSGE